MLYIYPTTIWVGLEGFSCDISYVKSIWDGPGSFLDLGPMSWGGIKQIKLDADMYISGQIITTSAEVTLNGGLVREFPPKCP